MLRELPRDEPLMKVIRAVIEALVPGGRIINAAADAVFAYVDRHETRRDLEQALEKAGRRFHAEASRRGWGTQSRTLLQSLNQDPTVLEEALRSALGRGETAPLQQTLETHFQNIPNVEPSLAVQAARLYAALILDELWKVDVFREYVRDALFREQVSDFEKLKDQITRLSRWWTLTPVAHFPGRI